MKRWRNESASREEIRELIKGRTIILLERYEAGLKKKRDCASHNNLHTTYGYVSFISLNDDVNIGFCDISEISEKRARTVRNEICE